MAESEFDYPTMARALIIGDKDTVARKTREGLDLSMDPKTLIFKGLIPGMDVVGEKFRRNEYYVPQVLLSARAMYAGLDLLKPLITKAGGDGQSLGVIVIGTAQGDLHDIGKNLVAMMLEGAGFKVHNLGRDVAPEKFVAAVEEHRAQIVGISALMTTTMPAMKRTIAALEKAGVRARVKVNTDRIGERTAELNRKGGRLARSVCPPGGYVAGSVGPTSCLRLDYGVGDNVATDEQYFATFKEQAEALAEGGVDIFAVETMMFPQEAIGAIKACKAAADLPVMATMFFQYEEIHDRDRTMWGESPAEVARTLLDAGADIVGMNCGRGPDRAIVIIREMGAVTDAPLIAYPNAGLPITKGDTTTYELGPEAMAKDYPALLDAGCNIVGACCGSGPEHIRLIAEVARSRNRR